MEALKAVPAEGITTETIIAEVTDQQIVELVRRTYGLTVRKLRRLYGWDDRNFHLLMADDGKSNDRMTEICDQGYVLKVINSKHSKIPSLFGSTLRHCFFQCYDDFFEILVFIACLLPIIFIIADFRTRLLLHMRNAGLRCPRPVKTLSGQYHVLEKFYNVHVNGKSIDDNTGTNAGPFPRG